MQEVLNKEKHRQEIERLKEQNKISEERIQYLKDMERKLKVIVIDWRKAEDKNEVVKTIHALLFQQKEKLAPSKKQKKLDDRFEEINGDIHIGDKVKMKQNRQVGTVKEIRGKKAILQVGIMPITVSLHDLVLVKEKAPE